MNPFARGCLLGQLAGDALGSLVELEGPVTIATAYPDGVRDLADGGTWGTLAGQPTDDSELALELARTLTQHGRYDAGLALDAYISWLDSNPFDVGSTIGAALTAARRLPPDQRALGPAAAGASSQANGSLMRMSPLGIFAVGQPDAGAAWAREDSRLTHPHPICQDACAVFVATIARLMAGAAPDSAHEAALGDARAPGFAPEVRDALERLADAPPADFVRQAGWVLTALGNAFHQLVRAPSLEEGVVATVMRGGDTDTNAAIAGALLGAAHGEAAIPPRWRATLLACRPIPGSATRHPRPERYWPVDALALADALAIARK